MVVQRLGGTCDRDGALRSAGALELIERYRVTHTQMVPTMFVRLLQLPRRRDFDLCRLRSRRSRRRAVPGSGQSADDRLARARRPRVLLLHRGPPVHGDLGRGVAHSQGLRRPRAAGQAAHPRRRRRELPTGETGTVWSEDGPRFEYHNDPDKTAGARAPRRGTRRSATSAPSTPRLPVPDRPQHDLIISGGVNVYPQEAENALIEHPPVRTRRLRHPAPRARRGGQGRRAARLAAGPSREELLAFCHERLAKFKCPRSVDFADELPRHATGKLYKRLLRDQYAAAAEERATPR